MSIMETTAKELYRQPLRPSEPKTAKGKVFNLVRLSKGGVTRDEAQLRLAGLSPSTVSSALSELAKQKLIVVSDETRNTRYGRPAMVYMRRSK